MRSVATDCGYINTHSYEQYVDDHKGEFQFPNTGYEAQYYIAPQVRDFN